MRILSILTSSALLLVLHELVSVWFLVDYFLARDSSTINDFKKRASHTNHNAEPPFEKDHSRQRYIIDTISNDLKDKHCHLRPGSHEPVFDKMIFIVIDALGSEFITSLQRSKLKNSQSNMSFLDSLISDGKASGFTAVAATPTVTMPRLKALVSGSMPSFFDILSNLARDVSSSSKDDDNLLNIAKSRGKKIVFYGDDTWLSLFDRSTFLRSRETLSLYASDYTSVDTNVTEMALPETRRDPIDWDYLILHYLGLDHIGHSFGSSDNPLISKKLKEMDNVLKQIHENMSSKNHRTLIIVCGDHGMSREGNHGGDSDLEANTAMLFLPINIDFSNQRQSHYRETKFLQIDLATTLSYLTAMPTPSMSRGVPIRSLLADIHRNSDEMLLCIALDNFIHLIGLMDDKSIGSNNSYSNKDSANNDLGSQIIELLNEHAISTASDTTNKLMTDKYFNLSRKIQDHLISTISTKSSSVVMVASVVLIAILTLLNLRRSCIKLHLPLMPFREKTLCLIVAVLPIFMQISTDYIELEHHYWPIYSFLVFLSFLLISLGTAKRQSMILNHVDWPRVIVFFVAFALNYSWNKLDEIRAYQSWWPSVLALIIMCSFSRQNSDLSSAFPRLSSAIFYSVGLAVYVTKSIEDSALINQSLDTSIVIDTMFPVASAQVLCFMLMVSITFINIWSSYKHGNAQASSLVQKLAISWMWFALILSRSRNFPYLVSNVLLEASVNSIANTFHLGPMARCLIYIQFSVNAFYNQGNTNLFTSIDVKPAFFGQSNYNLLLAIPLVASATYSSQIYWYLKLFQRVQGDKELDHMQPFSTSPNYRQQTHQYSGATELRVGVRDFIDMLNFLALAFYMCVCLVLRNHLFVWSVLSPKLVYHWMGTMIALRLTTLTVSTLPAIAVYFLSPALKENQYAKIKPSSSSNV